MTALNYMNNNIDIQNVVHYLLKEFDLITNDVNDYDIERDDLFYHLVYNSYPDIYFKVTIYEGLRKVPSISVTMWTSNMQVNLTIYSEGRVNHDMRKLFLTVLHAYINIDIKEKK